MFLYLKRWIANKVLLQKETKIARKVKVQTVQNSKKAIMFISIKPDSIPENILQLKQWFQSKNIELKLVAYSSYRKLAPVWKDIPSMEIFEPQHFNWLGFPKEKRLIKILREEYEILIHYDKKYLFQMDAICRLSNANFKIGHGSHREGFDFIISFSGNYSDKDWMDQLKHYLISINAG